MARFEEEMKQEEMVGNMIVMGISLVVIAAVVIGVVAGVDSANSSGEGASNITLEAICKQTDYMEACKSNLASVGDQGKVIDYFKAAVDAASAEMGIVKNKIKLEAESAPTQGEKMVLEDIVEMTELSIEELEYLMTMAKTNPNLFGAGSADARNSLSAVVSYLQQCLVGSSEIDSFDDKYDLTRTLKRSMELASNALAIIYENSQNDDKDATLQAPNTITRRSTSEVGVEDDGYPAWFSDPNRELLESNKDSQTPNAVVAQDGSEQYETITEALNAYQNGHKEQQYVIYVKKGVYKENVIIPKNMPQVFMYGDGDKDTIIAGVNIVGSLYRAATLSAIGNGFICKDIGIKIPVGSEAEHMVALKVQSDHAAFFNCRIEAKRYTILAIGHRQFIRDCEIHGSTNMIKGDSALVIQSTKIIVKKPLFGLPNMITMQTRSDKRENTGFVIHGCTIEPDELYGLPTLNTTTYLGMIGEKYARTIIMETTLGNIINPNGWFDNNSSFGIETVTYVEYGNNGPGARINNRITWPGYTAVIDKMDVLRYTPPRFIQADKWLPSTGIPFQARLFS